LLEIVGTLAVKPTYDASLKDALNEGMKLAGLADEPAKEKKAKKAK
jgi:hypothetical protein